MASDSKVTSIDKPRCSRCGSFKSVGELNGYDPLASTGQKFKAAYCRRLIDCVSQESKTTLDKLVSDLDN